MFSQISTRGPALFDDRLSTVSRLPSSCSGSVGGRRAAVASARRRRSRHATSSARITTDYHSVVTHAAAPDSPHRDLQHSSLPRPRRPHAPRSHRRRASRAIDADVVALQEVVGAGPHDGGHAEELGALLGMGWVMAPARHLRGHQFGNAGAQPAADRAAPRARSVVEDVRAAAAAARRRRRRTGGTLHVYNVHLGTAILERRHQARAAGDDRRRPPRRRAEAGARRLQRVDARPGDQDAERAAEQRRPAQSPAAGAAPTPVSFRSCISITSTTPDGSRFVSIELPRTRLSLVASDHLPLVAEVRIG